MKMLRVELVVEGDEHRPLSTHTIVGPYQENGKKHPIVTLVDDWFEEQGVYATGTWHYKKAETFEYINLAECPDCNQDDGCFTD